MLVFIKKGWAILTKISLKSRFSVPVTQIPIPGLNPKENWAEFLDWHHCHMRICCICTFHIHSILYIHIFSIEISDQRRDSASIFYPASKDCSESLSSAAFPPAWDYRLLAESSYFQIYFAGHDRIVGSYSLSTQHVILGPPWFATKCGILIKWIGIQ